MRKDALTDINEIFAKDMQDPGFRSGVEIEYNKLVNAYKHKKDTH